MNSIYTAPTDLDYVRQFITQEDREAEIEIDAREAVQNFDDRLYQKGSFYAVEFLQCIGDECYFEVRNDNTGNTFTVKKHYEDI